jgi:hypothetical protein
VLLFLAAAYQKAKDASPELSPVPGVSAGVSPVPFISLVPGTVPVHGISSFLPGVSSPSHGFTSLRNVRRKAKQTRAVAPGSDKKYKAKRSISWPNAIKERVERLMA